MVPSRFFTMTTLEHQLQLKGDAAGSMTSCASIAIHLYDMLVDNRKLSSRITLQLFAVRCVVAGIYVVLQNVHSTYVELRLELNKTCDRNDFMNSFA